MNQQNFEYLKENLKYTGFGEGLSTPLAEALKKGEPSFQLTFESQINRKAFAAVLNFRRGENSDTYFFNSYHASLQRTNGELVDQSFYLNMGKGVTAKEAFNLLEGRAVYKELTNKEGAKYHAWLQLNFKGKDQNGQYEVRQFHESYGYNLGDALAKYPIRELKEPDLKDVLILSLQKGNLHGIGLEKEGGITKLFIEANPQFKSINFYDTELKKVQKESLERTPGQQATTQKQGKQPEEKIDGKDKGHKTRIK